MIKRKGLKLKPKESTHERKFKAYAESKGCEVRKFSRKRDDPDRIILCPGGRVLFVEFKRDEDETPRSGQLARLKELADLDFRCVLCWSYEFARRMLDEVLSETHSF